MSEETKKINPLDFTLDFQENLLKFLLSSNNGYEGSKYISYLNPDCFDSIHHQMCMELIESYHKQYQVSPRDAANLIEHFHNSLGKVNLADNIIKDVERSIRSLYQPFKADTPILIESLIEYSQYTQAISVVKECVPKLSDGREVFKRFKMGMEKVLKIGEVLNDEHADKGGYLVKDRGTAKSTRPVAGHPCFLSGINKMTAAKGFHTPQLVIIMAQPKGFKTGTALNIAMGYMMDGFKVYYADFENGSASILNRMKQCLTGATREELMEGTHDERLMAILSKIERNGGEIRVDRYLANVHSTNDVEARLDELKELDNFEPQIIVWDYPDLIASTDSSIKETRKISNRVYHDIISVNTRRGVFSFALSQVSKQAVDKATITIKDFAEDFAKAMNAHAAFAICRTPDEIQAGTARIVPVMQREGFSQGRVDPCFVNINEERMIMEESNPEMEARMLRRKQR